MPSEASNLDKGAIKNINDKYISCFINYKLLVWSERQLKMNIQVGLVAPPTLVCLLEVKQRGANMFVILILFSVNSVGGAFLFQPKAFYMGFFFRISKFSFFFSKNLIFSKSGLSRILRPTRQVWYTM